MQLEYNRWQMMQNILRHFSPSFYDLYNYTPGILEAWILPAVSDSGIQKFDAGELNLGYLEKQLKRIGKVHEYKEYVEVINFMYKNFTQKPTNSLFKINLEKNDKFYTFTYGQFSRQIETERAIILLEMAPLESVMRMIMRYAFIIIRGSHQWAAPILLYENMKKYFNIEIEGFGSPLNSRILMITKGKKKNIFCSLFYDTDEVFGSRGNFFNQNFNGLRVFMNPPFLSNVILNILKMVEKSLNENKNGLFIVCFPEWPKEECYKEFLRSKYLKYHYVYNKFNHWYVHGNEKIKPTFNSAYFLLTSLNVENKLPDLYK